MSTEQPINPEVLDTLSELVGDKFIELIEVYLSDSEIRIQKIEKAFDDGDTNTLANEAHGLKGSSRNLGANDVASICEVLETESRAGKLGDKVQTMASIEKTFAAVAAQLKTYL